MKQKIYTSSLQVIKRENISFYTHWLLDLLSLATGQTVLYVPWWLKHIPPCAEPCPRLLGCCHWIGALSLSTKGISIFFVRPAVSEWWRTWKYQWIPWLWAHCLISLTVRSNNLWNIMMMDRIFCEFMYAHFGRIITRRKIKFISRIGIYSNKYKVLSIHKESGII